MKILKSALLMLLLMLLPVGCAPPSRNAPPASAAPPQASSSQSASSEASPQDSSPQTQSSGASSQASSSQPASSSAPSATPAADTVSLTIDSSRAAGGRKLSFPDLPLKKGDTVYSLLKRVCEGKNLDLSARTSPAAYVEAIDGIAEFDCGPMSGWIYSVNGISPNQPCDRCFLRPGDDVLWEYTLDGEKTK